MLGALVAVGAGAGCYVPHFLVWLFKPDQITRSVKAEYDLKAECLVIVPYAGTDILFTYPTVPIEVSQELVYAIVRDLGGASRRWSTRSRWCVGRNPRSSGRT